MKIKLLSTDFAPSSELDLGIMFDIVLVECDSQRFTDSVGKNVAAH